MASAPGWDIDFKLFLSLIASPSVACQYSSEGLFLAKSDAVLEHDSRLLFFVRPRKYFVLNEKRFNNKTVSSGLKSSSFVTKNPFLLS